MTGPAGFYRLVAGQPEERTKCGNCKGRSPGYRRRQRHRRGGGAGARQGRRPVVLTGRRREKLDGVAKRIKDGGGTTFVKPGDLMKASTAQKVAAFIKEKLGRLDILVNNAGLNILERSWSQLKPEGADEVIDGNLSSAFYCVIAALPMMRAQQDGILIHTASWAGRWVGPLSGPAYVAAKHGAVAMSHSINMEECVNGIRSTCVCPGEVATADLDRRPVPVSKADRDRMVQSEDCGDLIRYIACLPKHVCINEVVISPTWNRGYVAGAPGQGKTSPAKKMTANRKRLLVPTTLVPAGCEVLQGREDVETVTYVPFMPTPEFRALLRDVDGIALSVTPSPPASSRRHRACRSSRAWGVGYRRRRRAGADAPADPADGRRHRQLGDGGRAGGVPHDDAGEARRRHGLHRAREPLGRQIRRAAERAL